MMLTLQVPEATPSLNAFSNPSGRRWKYLRLRRHWKVAIKDALLEARAATRTPLAWPRPPKEFVLVQVTRYAPAHHWLDADNLAGGMKPLLDALKAHEVIADDAPTAIDLVPRQEVSPHAQPSRWTEIRLSIDPPLLREEHA